MHRRHFTIPRPPMTLTTKIIIAIIAGFVLVLVAAAFQPGVVKNQCLFTDAMCKI